jgi:hypothetical protein
MNETDDGERRAYQLVTTSNNPCERCQALSRCRWDAPPGQAHAHCACEVEVLFVGRRTPRECGDSTFRIEHLNGGTKRYGPGGLDGFEWGFKATIECWTGDTWEFEIWVDMGPDDTYSMDNEGYQMMQDLAWNEIHDEAEAIISRVCRPCEEQPIA